MSCYLIEELLPLYIEGDTSEETNQLVDEHLRSCKKCRYLYEEMKEPVSIAKSTDFIPFIDEKEEKESLKSATMENCYYGQVSFLVSSISSCS